MPVIEPEASNTIIASDSHLAVSGLGVVAGVVACATRSDAPSSDRASRAGQAFGIGNRDQRKA
jgi:hypothetical protein